MGKRETANDSDPEPGWGDFIAHHRQRIEDREEICIPLPKQPSITDRLEDIPADVPYADDMITCWNGKAFVSWKKWRLSVAFTPIVESEEKEVF